MVGTSKLAALLTVALAAFSAVPAANALHVTINGSLTEGTQTSTVSGSFDYDFVANPLLATNSTLVMSGAVNEVFDKFLFVLATPQLDFAFTTAATINGDVFHVVFPSDFLFNTTVLGNPSGNLEEIYLTCNTFSVSCQTAYQGFAAARPGGTYTVPDVTASVPEPDTLLLLGAALTGLGFLRRRLSL